MTNKETLEELKKEYQANTMSPEQVKHMMDGMDQAMSQNGKGQKEKSKKRKVLPIYRWAGAAAAALAIVIILPNTNPEIAHAMSNIPVLGKFVDVVTFRDYKYDSDRQKADINVPELVVNEVEQPENPDAKAPQENMEPQVTDTKKEDTLQKTTEEINQEIQQISDKLVKEFEANKKKEEGYQDISTSYEVLETTENYFTIKLICIQAAGSGSEQDYYYTIDLSTGERLKMEDLFKQDTDYITPISENIKQQMKDQMAKDDKVQYWVDYKDVPEWNFEKITDDTSFYINEKDELVISFNDGDVAPMYMGCVNFVIEDDVIQDIRK